MQKIPIVFYERFLLDESNFSDETSKGLQAIVAQIVSSPFKDCVEWIEPSKMDSTFWMTICQSSQYLSQLKSLAQSQNSAQLSISLRSLNTWFIGLDICRRRNTPVFILLPLSEHRPIFSNAVVNLAASLKLVTHYALAQESINRIAILDWSVLPNSEIQTLAQGEPNLTYCSLYQESLSLKFNWAEPQIKFDNVLNILLSSKNIFSFFRMTFKSKVLPFLSQFSPDLLIVNVGLGSPSTQLDSKPSQITKDSYYLTKYALTVTPKVIFTFEKNYHCHPVAQTVLEAIRACCCHSAKSTIIQQFINKQQFYL